MGRGWRVGRGIRAGGLCHLIPRPGHRPLCPSSSLTRLNTPGQSEVSCVHLLRF